jgi:branched-chain amino acid transport system ATP-binding protein
MLKINNLNVSYGNFEALRNLSLDINEGEIVALLGSNGAGKSTTINTISGMTNLRGGEIIFNGEPIHELPVYERVKKGIVQVPEGRKLFPHMTIMDNLMVGAFVRRDNNFRKNTLEMIFEMFPKLAERKTQLAGSLSGGEQQMCAIARGLMANPKVLMLDEPSLGLAPVVVEKIFEVIVKINKMGTAILLVEQNVLASLEIATRGYVIETGENVIQGSREELIGNEDLRKAYLGI